MESETALKAANNEVMRKIGRNMLLFQQIEGLLKYLLANGSISGTMADLKTKRESRVAEIKRKTMGQLVGEFVDSTYSDNKNTKSQDQLDEVYVSFNFHVECEADHYESQKRVLAELVAERNDLIHHFLPKYNSESLESCQVINTQLEQQHEKLLPEVRNLKALVRSLDEARKVLAEFINSEDGHKLFVEGVLPGESRLDGLLRNIASLAARADGWVPLATAGELINKQSAEKIDKICEERGIKKLRHLKKLIKASPAFELKEEPNKGGTQWLFRIKESAAEEQV